jgi:hypothetical protein
LRGQSGKGMLTLSRFLIICNGNLSIMKKRVAKNFTHPQNAGASSHA